MEILLFPIYLISFPLIMSIILITFLCISFTSFPEINSLYSWNLINYFNFELVVDPTRIIFIVVVSLISFRVILFTRSYIVNDQRLMYFTLIVILFIIAIIILILIPNLIFLIIGWDGLGVSSFLLIVYYIGDKSFLSGIVTLLTNRVGDCLLLIACSWSFSRMNWSYSLIEYKINRIVCFVLILGAITKRAQRPFCSWLPAAIAAPTPVSALVHSSTLVTAGVYLLIRFYSSLSIFIYFNSFIMYTGVITCLLARTSALYETDLKKIIALSTLRQLGVIFITLGLGEPEVCFFHLVTHALFKALLFMCAGSLIHRIGDNQDIRIIGSVCISIPITSITINIANLSLCGIPFLSGFYSKDTLIEIFIIRSNPLFTRFILFVRVLSTAAYTTRLTFFRLFDFYKGRSIITNNDERLITLISYIILILGAIMAGIVFQWKFEPSLIPIVLPIHMKVSTLLIVILFRVTIYYLNIKGKVFILRNFFTTILLTNYGSGWYNYIYVSLTKKLLSVEIYWIEIFGGLLLKKIIIFNQKNTQSIIRSNWVLVTSSIFFSMIYIYYIFTNWFDNKGLQIP